MTRPEAQKIISDIGGINAKTVNNQTDYLIVGQQDYRIVGDDVLSRKQEKAIEILQKGGAIEVLSEDEFLRNI